MSEIEMPTQQGLYTQRETRYRESQDGNNYPVPVLQSRFIGVPRSYIVPPKVHVHIDKQVETQRADIKVYALDDEIRLNPPAIENLSWTA